MNPDESPTPESPQPLTPQSRETSPSPTESPSRFDRPAPKPDFSGTSAAPAPGEPAPSPQLRQSLKEEIAALQALKAQTSAEYEQMKAAMAGLVKESLREVQQRRKALEVEIEQLERRQERIRKEMQTTFAGASQDLAMRVQGFKEYLVGSLQDLAATAEQLDLVPPAPPPRAAERPASEERGGERPSPQFAGQGFQEETRQIRRLLDRYRNQPDYYGPPWQLRRTFEPIHAERVSYWFFTQGGRGALRTMGSRLQNVLIASAIASVLRSLYDRRLCVLILANTPERLGEWRRGLQDCLGIARADFGPDRGVVLCEAPEPLAQRGDRLLQAGRLPLILIDESEDRIPLSMLQFPLWLAFAADPDTSNFY
ncbi:MAG: DUF3086 domain-containing protein [Cyanobacteriota bacterium]|nr:DUF3086 domain-containing protein [Cyanobacteriota bacterium]